MAHTVVAATELVPAGLPSYPIPRVSSCPFDPPPALRALREEGPVTRVRLWDGATPVSYTHLTLPTNREV